MNMINIQEKLKQAFQAMSCEDFPATGDSVEQLRSQICELIREGQLSSITEEELEDLTDTQVINFAIATW